MNCNPIIVKQSDLPRPIVVVGPSGQRELYELNPAGKGKVGAALVGASPLVKQVIKERIRNR